LRNVYNHRPSTGDKPDENTKLLIDQQSREGNAEDQAEVFGSVVKEHL
jgi:hypothetical protein